MTRPIYDDLSREQRFATCLVAGYRFARSIFIIGKIDKTEELAGPVARSDFQS
jgi:hypothetical protein